MAIRYVLSVDQRALPHAREIREMWEEALRAHRTQSVVVGPGITVQDLGPQRPMAAFLRRARARVR